MACILQFFEDGKTVIIIVCVCMYIYVVYTGLTVQATTYSYIIGVHEFYFLFFGRKLTTYFSATHNTNYLFSQKSIPTKGGCIVFRMGGDICNNKADRKMKGMFRNGIDCVFVLCTGTRRNISMNFLFFRLSPFSPVSRKTKTRHLHS